MSLSAQQDALLAAAFAKMDAAVDNLLRPETDEVSAWLKRVDSIADELKAGKEFFT